MDWRESALCKKMDSSYFSYSDLDDLHQQGVPAGKCGQVNLERMQEAVQVCSICPVREECYSTADEADLYWSVRGGVLPGRLAGKSQSKVRSTGLDHLPYICRKGHTTEASNLLPVGFSYRCPECNAEKRRVDDERKSSKRSAKLEE